MPRDHPLSTVPAGERILAEKIVRLERMVRDLAQASQAADRSVENGAIDVYDDDDNLQVSLGRKKDDKHGAGYVGTAQPPKPTIPDVLAIPGGMLVFWDGRLEEATDIPIERVAIFASTVSGFKIDLENIEDPDPDDDGAQEVGEIRSDGGGTCVIPTWGEERIYIRAVAISESGVPSDPTVQVDGYAVETDIAFFVDEFTLEEDGTQDLHLTYEPLDYSEHVYWHVGGADGAGLYQQDDVTWTRDEQTLTILDSPATARAGDVVSVKYAYLVGEPAGNRIVAQIVSSAHADTWGVHLRWNLTDSDDVEDVNLLGVNDAGPWDAQEVGFVPLADITLRFAGVGFTVDYPNPSHISRTSISGEDDEGEYTGHRYTLTDQEWHDDLSSLPAEELKIGPTTGYTTTGDVDYGSEVNYRLLFGLSKGYQVLRAYLTPDPPIYDRGDAWGWMYDHIKNMSQAGSQRYNNPPSEFFWTGSAIEAALLFGGYGSYLSHGPTGLDGNVGYSLYAALDSWQSLVAGNTTAIGLRFNLPNLLIELPPNAGHPDPVPPPGKTLEWEYPHPEIEQIEVSLSEPNAAHATNTGTIYLGHSDADMHGFGPNPAADSQWRNLAGYDNTIVTPSGWTGASNDWHDVTAMIKDDAATYFTVVTDTVAMGVEHGTGSYGFSASANRGGVLGVFKVSLKARRYRFVPVDADQTLVLDVKSYTDPDEV